MERGVKLAVIDLVSSSSRVIETMQISDCGDEQEISRMQSSADNIMAAPFSVDK